MKSILGIDLPSVYLGFLENIKLGEVFNINGTGIYFYSFFDLEERNITYAIQEEEPQFLLIGQDGDLAFFIKSGEEMIYSNDLGAIGLLGMECVSENINSFIEYAKENYDCL